MLKRVNLQRKLEAFRDRSVSEEELLEQVQAIFRQEQEKEEAILERLHEGGICNSNDFKVDKMDTGRIFYLSHIKKLCIEYRLRFLEVRYFKSSLPIEALQEIKRLEKEHQTELRGFRIMAPSKHFKLENADDPILFAPIGNDYYYRVHKWGKDLHPLRKLVMWPLKSIENLGIFVFLFSFLGALVFREVFYSQYRSTSEFIMLYLFTFKSVLGLILFYGIALGKNFNSCIWKSKYYNA